MKIVYFLAALLFSLTSCKKTEHQTPAKTQIKGFTIIAETLVGNYYADFSLDYDSYGRVKKFYSLHRDSANNPIDSIFTFVFTYENKFVLPSTIDYSYPFGGVNERKTHHLTYNAQNKLIKDSLVFKYPGYYYPPYVITYHHQNNRVIKRFNSGLGIEDTATVSNENYVSLSGTRRTDYVFDNGLNPLYDLNIAPIFDMLCLPSYYGGSYYSLWFLGNRNNVTQILHRHSNYTDVTKLGYVYDSEGRMIKRYFYGPNNVSVIDTMIIRY